MLRLFISAKYFAGYTGYYINDDGSISESFFNPTEYNEGFAVVHTSPSFFSNTYFRDEQGNLSEELAEAENFLNGISIVKKLNERNYRLRDTKGNYSEDSYRFIKRVNHYPYIFEVYNEKNETPKYRTISGKITDSLQKALYFSNKITIFELEPSFFADSDFVAQVKENERIFFENERRKTTSNKTLEEINKLEAKVLSYIDEQTKTAIYNQPN